ncbi:hypothetical protein [Butyrivibrio sp. AE3009]|uniref:hypothetical protein n=1 Tax=Butyrivibrio sp. AE3009 TaxID=1280666 RepID=UPI0003B60768|nr:hypothetical protein [Butyrivibrio sp. AE3009]
MIDSSKLKYKAFKDPRSETVEGFTEGFSGKLLLATAPDGKKYIVKHEEMTDAGNEFVACFIGKRMGVPVPEAHILLPDRRLNSPFAVAIEYLDCLELVGAYEKLSEQEKKDVCSQYALSILVDNTDVVQLFRRKGRIVQVDFADALAMSSMMLTVAYGTGNIGMAKQYIKNYSNYFAETLGYMDFEFPDLARSLGMEAGAEEKLMLETARRVLDITEDDIKGVGKELAIIYPDEMVEHYTNAIRVIQEKVADA